ncbi:carbamoyltransferase HypF [candidate division KSB1 bacterium]|nr:carbamoyltransferase HypF [candidate division KSB1 bacterium]
MRQRVKSVVTGIVQGIGFRPFVFNLARELELSGFVQNTSNGVTIEVEGESERVSMFFERIRHNRPSMAVVTSLDWESITPSGETRFQIRKSASGAERNTLISPDIAVCDECLAELFNPANRRYRYPFINCTNCGPRYTIINDIPYDRPHTSMHDFQMCPQCLDEYNDPTNRRFHAQPTACAVCGPQVRLLTADRKMRRDGDPIAETIRLIEQGAIACIKGLGGFHLAVHAENNHAIKRLRHLKHREEKPFAVMARDVEHVRKLACVSEDELKLLTSPARPIVLLTRKSADSLADQVAPRNPYLGVMLPYTPLHHLLLQHEQSAWVMTSANISDEPIAIDNDDALHRLGKIADYFLVHDLRIYERIDDSIVRSVGDNQQLVRRSRGYVPAPILMQQSMPAILACGAELKNTVCLTKGNRAFLSQHIGDLKNRESYQFYQHTINHLQRILDIHPEIIAYDMHPNYLSSRYALEQDIGIRKIPVQHHHAHIMSCMAEHHLDGPVIGLAFDGTGYGTDGNIWGGEALVVDGAKFERVAHLEYMPMPGGDLAIREPWRMALSYLYYSFGNDIFDMPSSFWNCTDEQQRRICLSMIQKNFNSPLTSSLGRLFDGVASLLRICQHASYEGQPAIMLEMIMENSEKYIPYKFEWKRKEDCYIIQLRSILNGVIQDILARQKAGTISARFHETIIHLFCELCIQLKSDTGLNRVVMSGGVFQNVCLATGLRDALEQREFTVFTQQYVPSNDGGIALGQAAIAAAIES